MKIIYIVAISSLLVSLTACQQKAKPEPKKTVETPIEKNQKDWRNDWRAENKETASRLVKKFLVSKEIDNLPKSDSYMSWSENFATGLSCWVGEPRIYTPLNFLSMHRFNSFEETDRARQDAMDYHMNVLVAYGLLQTGNSNVDKENIKKQLVEIFLGDKSLDFALAKGMPAVKVAFGLMPHSTRQNYMKIFRHTSDYMANLTRMEDEVAYYESLQERNGCRTTVWQKKYYVLPSWMSRDDDDDYYRSCKALFTRFGPDGKKNPYRKAEAFVFRRYHFDEWPIERMKKTLDRVIAELAPLV